MLMKVISSTNPIPLFMYLFMRMLCMAHAEQISGLQNEYSESDIKSERFDFSLFRILLTSEGSSKQLRGIGSLMAEWLISVLWSMF